MICIGTKIDLREDKVTNSRDKKYKVKNIKTEDGMEMAKRMKAHAFLECSCKTFEGVDEVFFEAARYFLHHPTTSRKRDKNGCTCMLL